MRTEQVTGRELRRRYRAARAAREGRSPRRPLAVGLVLAGLALLIATPVLAGTGRAYRLQGTNLATEFVVQPYRLAAGTLDGRHVRLESGLLGFTDGAGTTGSGYCIDARAHRRHDAVYTDGSPLDGSVAGNPRQVRWLLARAFPNGPALLGSDPAGIARSSSVVQAAIWHFSDGFQLDPAGAPYVDTSYRAAYDRLVAAASAGLDPRKVAIRVTLPDAPIAAGRPARAVATLTGADGTVVVDGTEVSFVSSGGWLAPASAGPRQPGLQRLTVRTVGGQAVAWAGGPAGPGSSLELRASAMLPVPPGRVLVATLPTQRLVETSWGQERVVAQARMTFTAPVSPSPIVASPPPVVAAPSPRGTPPASPSATSRPPSRPTPPAAGPVAAPTPVIAPRPAPPVVTYAPPAPSAGESIISMPNTGHRRALSPTLAAGLALVGAGLLLGLSGSARRARI
jgi:TQXA domain-containing protein